MSKIVKLGIVTVCVAAVAVAVTAAVGTVSHFGNTAIEKVPGPGSLGRAAVIDARQGGEDCGSATPLGALPATVSGTTIGYLDDYEEACPYDATAPDVVYSYTATEDMIVTASLCTPGTNTDYDTKLFIYEGSCPGTVNACNDDSCTSPLYAGAYVSELSTTFTAGTTYYFVVDGYSSNEGNYTLYVEGTPLQTCPCPPGTDVDEGVLDPNCGNTDFGLDPTGGCNSDANNGTAYMVPIACNTTICGTTGTFTTSAPSDSRDTDWFNLVLPQADTVRVTLESEADLYLFEIAPTDCATAAVAQQLDQVNCSGTGEMVINGQAGNNWLWVGPQHFGPPYVPCGTEYTLTVTCDVVPVELQSLTIE